MKSAVAIITARGGSKRIPGKNIRNFLGKPIIAYSIEAALQSGLFQEVMVSTDSEEIADVAIKYGAVVPFMRSAANADDFSTTPDVLVEVVNRYAEAGIRFDYGCCIYPTAPFISASLLQMAFEKLTSENRDSIFPAVAFGFPIYRGMRKDESGVISYIWPEHERTRSQDLPKTYHDAGQFYWFRPQLLLQTKSLVSKNSAIVEVDDLQVQDIDNETDWKLAELKYTLIKQETEK